MIPGWLETPEFGAATRDAIAAVIPTLETERLVLRAPQLADWPVLETAWTTERAEYIGGPFSDEDAYLDYCQAVASWTLRGFGPFVVTRKSDAAVIGYVGLFHDFGDPMCEAGWIMTPDGEGQGFATEAARAVLAFARNDLGMHEITSFIHPDNKRSIRLAEKLGARLDTTTQPPEFAGLNVAIYRHQLAQTISGITNGGSQ